MRFGFDGAIATPILPTGDLGMPLIARFHVVPPSCERNTPLPAPPLSIFQVCITSDHMPAAIVFGSLGSSERLEQPVLGSTNSTRCQVRPPSVVRYTPRSSCGPVARPRA